MFSVTRHSTSAEEAVNSRHQWPVRLVATNTSDDSSAFIFVMQSKVDDRIGDQFSCVASAIQMHDLPETEINSEGPFYRVADFTILCRSADAAEEFYTKVMRAVQNLADNIDSSERLSSAETVVITPTEI